MDESEKKLIIRFCQVEGAKTTLLNMMQIFLRFQDYIAHKKQEPDGKTIFLWFLNFLNNEITQAATYSKGKSLIEAQNLIAKVIQDFSNSSTADDYTKILDLLREAITKITSEAAYIADDLKF